MNICIVLLAALRLSAPFTDGVVLQRERPVRIWGWTDAGGKVTVQFAGQRQSAVAAADGRWELSLAPMAASKEGRVLRVDDGKDSIEVKDVLVGEVWLVSGQSNAMFPLWEHNVRYRDRNGALVARMTKNGNLRYCAIRPNEWSVTPRDGYSYAMEWKRFTPENLEIGYFSAIGVYFARELYLALDIPIGLVGIYWGGTNIDAWIPRCGYEKYPELADMRDWKLIEKFDKKTMEVPPIYDGWQQPTAIFNAMVAPWVPYTFRGALWYQGCHNSGDGEWERYCSKMHALYDGWAKVFQDPAFEFLFVQLAPWGNENIAMIQQQQAKFAAEEPRAAMVVAGDYGNLKDIHPNEKETIARRLAALALRRDYGWDELTAYSPTLKEWRIEGDKFLLTFNDANGFWLYNDDPRSMETRFEVCGKEGEWHPAEIVNFEAYKMWDGVVRSPGTITGNVIAVSSKQVASPTRLRYLHSRPWIPNLYSDACLPIGPFHIGEDEVEEAVSPDGRNKIVLVKSQRPTIQVFRNGKPMMKPSPVAMKFDRADVRAEIELYADNDGVAYRWKTSADGSVKVLDENAGINALSPDQRVHLQQANNLFKGDPFQNSWEHPAFGMKLREVSSATNTLYFAPILFTGENGAMAVTESDLRDYPGLNYRRARSCQRLDSAFARWPVKCINTDWNEESQERVMRQKRVVDRADYLVETAAMRTYPWRVFLLADREIDLVRSAELVQRLAAPNAIGDASWIRPGKVAWDWWNDWNLTNVDFKAGCNTRTYEYYIDFAAANGVEYVILDEGWSAKLNIWKFNPEVDVPHLIEYAEKRGVGIILWIAWAQAHDEPERAAEHFAKMGAKGFKVDFMDRDDAEMVRFLERFADICAKRHLLLDYHGMYKPTGLEKTYPNILNFEGVFGLETMKFSKKFDMMQNDVNVVYSRLLAGPVDYTPGAMRNFTRGTYTMNNHEPGSYGTRCRQMALMVLYTAPLMMLCDSPSQYLQNMECFRFMAAGPVVWDEVRPIDGRVDEYAVLARRKGNTWYVAGITDWTPREITVDLSFLPAGTKLEVFRDAPDCDTCATHYVHEHITLPPDGKLPLFLAPGGGFVLKTE